MPVQASTVASPILSAAKLAAALGCDRHTIIDSWIPAGCPVAQAADKDKGVSWGFRLADVWRWAFAGEGGVGATATDIDGVMEMARRTKLQADLLELRLAQQRGKLVRIEDVSAAVQDEYTRVRSRLLALPAAIGMRCAGLATAEAVERAVRPLLAQALEELSQDGPALAAEVVESAPEEDLDYGE